MYGYFGIYVNNNSFILPHNQSIIHILFLLPLRTDRREKYKQSAINRIPKKSNIPLLFNKSSPGFLELSLSWSHIIQYLDSTFTEYL